jgi:hypothetical protein
MKIKLKMEGSPETVSFLMVIKTIDYDNFIQRVYRFEKRTSCMETYTHLM